ncbi:MAG: polyamine aminopropyltransferase [Thermoproteus sp.]
MIPQRGKELLSAVRPVWIETVSWHTSLAMQIEGIRLMKRTRYQELAIIDTVDFGRALVLDGFIQSSYFDEPYYHESLVHPAMVAHASPKRVLIVGGGEGATLREVLKHKTVAEAVMVDIDGEVVQAAREYLPVMHQGAFDDPRAKVLIMDGLKYVEEALARGEKFDVIIMDLTDPYGPEIAQSLYSTQFFGNVKRLLGRGGVLVTQAGDSFFFEEEYDAVLRNISANFKVVVEYTVWIPSFGYAVNFILASDEADPRALTAEEVDKILADRGVSTLFYSGRTHVALMNLPIYRKFKRA